MAKRGTSARKRTTTRKSAARKRAASKRAGRNRTSRKRTAAKRELVDTKRGGKRFVRRRAGGTFKESDQVGRSLPTDRRKPAKTKARRGQGDKGDR